MPRVTKEFYGENIVMIKDIDYGRQRGDYKIISFLSHNFEHF